MAKLMLDNGSTAGLAIVKPNSFICFAYNKTR